MLGASQSWLKSPFLSENPFAGSQFACPSNSRSALPCKTVFLALLYSLHYRRAYCTQYVLGLVVPSFGFASWGHLIALRISTSILGPSSLNRLPQSPIGQILFLNLLTSSASTCKHPFLSVKTLARVRSISLLAPEASIWFENWGLVGPGLKTGRPWLVKVQQTKACSTALRA